MNPILNYINKKNYNIFESIQLLYDMNMYNSIESIFKELKDIIPDTINISTEGITDEKTLFLLNHLNGRLLEPYGKHYIYFIKDNDFLFKWDLEYDEFWCDYFKIWKIFEDKDYISTKEIQVFVKDVLERHCKIMGVTPLAVIGVVED